MTAQAGVNGVCPGYRLRAERVTVEPKRTKKVRAHGWSRGTVGKGICSHCGREIALLANHDAVIGYHQERASGEPVNLDALLHREESSTLERYRVADAAAVQLNEALDSHGTACGHLDGVSVGLDVEGALWLKATIEGDLTARIRDLHRKGTGSGGMTSGYCTECDHVWPCPTYHVAAGWGLDSFHDCLEAGWCSHVQDVLR